MTATFHSRNPALQDSILVFNQDCELVSQLPIWTLCPKVLQTQKGQLQTFTVYNCPYAVLCSLIKLFCYIFLGKYIKEIFKKCLKISKIIFQSTSMSQTSSNFGIFPINKNQFPTYSLSITRAKIDL